MDLSISDGSKTRNSEGWAGPEACSDGCWADRAAARKETAATKVKHRTAKRAGRYGSGKHDDTVADRVWKAGCGCGRYNEEVRNYVTKE